MICLLLTLKAKALDSISLIYTGWNLYVNESLGMVEGSMPETLYTCKGK